MDGVLSSLLESTVSSLFDDAEIAQMAAAAAEAEAAAAAAEAAAGMEVEPGRQRSPGAVSMLSSPSKALPMDMPAPRSAAGAAGAAADSGLLQESYCSEDWGSFSPTGVLLGEAVAAGLVPSYAEVAAGTYSAAGLPLAAPAAAGVQAAPIGAGSPWGCKLQGGIAAQLGQHGGSPSRVVA